MRSACPSLLLVSTISRCLTCCTISISRACSCRRPNACCVREDGSSWSAITPLSGPFYRNLHPEPVIMSADPLLDGPLDPMPDAFEATSRCSFSTSLAIWSGARYGEAMHTVGRRLACGTRTRSCRLPEQKETVIFSRRWCLRQPGYLRVPRSRRGGLLDPALG